MTRVDGTPVLVRGSAGGVVATAFDATTGRVIGSRRLDGSPSLAITATLSDDPPRVLWANRDGVHAITLETGLAPSPAVIVDDGTRPDDAAHRVGHGLSAVDSAAERGWAFFQDQTDGDLVQVELPRGSHPPSPPRSVRATNPSGSTRGLYTSAIIVGDEVLVFDIAGRMGGGPRGTHRPFLTAEVTTIAIPSQQ